MPTTPIALTIAGSDSGGGAGIQADLKTFSALKVFGTSAITALAAENTHGVHDVYSVSADFVSRQIQSVCEDLGVAAAKTGMLANKEIIAATAKAIDTFKIKPLVVDPVIVAQTGETLLEDDAMPLLLHELIPRATLITPNLPEAAKLLGIAEEEVLAQPQQAAEALLELGPEAVLLKRCGSYKSGLGTDTAQTTDYYISRISPQDRSTLTNPRIAVTSPQDSSTLTNPRIAVTNPQDRSTLTNPSIAVTNPQDSFTLTNPRIAVTSTNGSGCTLAAAITAYLARQESLADAVKQGNAFAHNAIKHSAKLQIGTGPAGPVHHLHNFW